jgi:hypothetical protein
MAIARAKDCIEVELFLLKAWVNHNLWLSEIKKGALFIFNHRTLEPLHQQMNFNL